MRFAIAYCKNNTAGKNIVERFKELAFSPQIPVIELKKETVFSDDIDKEKYPELRGIDFLVFASSHKSSMKEPSLCLHAPGNWRSAELGGKDGKVCKTSSFILKYLFKELTKNAGEDESDKKYNVTLEVTHHGPLIKIPCCFIEVGSSEKEWNDKKAVNAVAKTILSLQNYEADKKWIAYIGVGGPHYAPNFNKIQLNSDYAVGHIIPEYSLPLTSSMLMEAEEGTLEQVKEVLVDWKGCGNSEERKQTISLLNKAGLKYKRTSEVGK